MARSRNIKPGFYKNEFLAECSLLARFIFPGLWMLADREGRLEDRPMRIKAELLPFEQANVDALLDELQEAGFIVRYNVGGTKAIQIANFAKHQVPHHKEIASVLPAAPGMPAITRHPHDVSAELRAEIFARDGNKCLRCGISTDLSVDHIKSLSDGGDNSKSNLQTLCKKCNSSKGGATKDYRTSNVEPTLNQRKVNGGASCRTDSLNLIPSSLIPDSLQEKMPRASRFGLHCLPEDWSDYCKAKRPDLDPASVFEAFSDFWHSKAGKDGRKLDWFATWRTWVRNEKDGRRPRNSQDVAAEAVKLIEADRAKH